MSDQPENVRPAQPEATQPSTSSPSPYDLALAHQRTSHSVSPIYTFLLSSPSHEHTILPPSTSTNNPTGTTAGTSLSTLILSDVHLNSKGSIHGSVSATIVDWASGNALATMGRGSGVSLDMHVTFLSTCRGGEKVVIKGTIDKLGSRIAFTRVEIKRERDDALIVTAIHTKFVG